MVLHKTKSNHRIGKEFPSQRQLTLNYSKLIRKIYKKDNRLTPRQQQTAIQALSGITINEMECIIKATGPKLAQSVRELISSHRAKTKRIKQKVRKAKARYKIRVKQRQS